MSLIRPLTRGLVQPITRPLLGRGLGGDGLTAAVKTLFASGEKGVMLDFTKAANLYTDSARTTPVTSPGDKIGSVTDLSGNEKHASSASSMRPSWDGGYATFDAFDDYLQTVAIDFSATDAVTVVAGVRKLSDASTGTVIEISGDSGVNNGSFAMFAPLGAGTSVAFRSKGSTSTVSATDAANASPVTAVFTGAGDISSDTCTFRKNGVQTAASAADQGIGNYGNYAMNIGARNTSGLFLNGRIYRLLVIGRALTTTERNAAERWAAQPVGITIP